MGIDAMIRQGLATQEFQEHKFKIMEEMGAGDHCDVLGVHSYWFSQLWIINTCRQIMVKYGYIGVKAVSVYGGWNQQPTQHLRRHWN